MRQIQRPLDAIQPGQAYPFALNHFTNQRGLFPERMCPQLFKYGFGRHALHANDQLAFICKV